MKSIKFYFQTQNYLFGIQITNDLVRYVRKTVGRSFITGVQIQREEQRWKAVKHHVLTQHTNTQKPKLRSNTILLVYMAAKWL